jgi:hypothetical protein
MLGFISTYRIQFAWMGVAALAAVLLGGGTPYNIVTAVETVAVAVGLSALVGFGVFDNQAYPVRFNLAVPLIVSAGAILYIYALMANWNIPKPLDIGVWAASMGLIVTATIRRVLQR